MAVAEILGPKPGERILDLAAAPGGKATHIAALMNNEGLLVANDIHPRRVWDLAQNIERSGVINSIITNESPGRLAKRFDSFFDRVLLDAPCSGEGMFRKSNEAIEAWSQQHVLSCAIRQLDILQCAATMVRPGGFLGYTTCTFSPEENEQVIAKFLDAQARSGCPYELIQITKKPQFQPGEARWAPSTSENTYLLERTVRLWPHLNAAEGHYIALMRRSSGNDKHRPLTRKKIAPMSALALLQEFERKALTIQFPEERLFLQGSYLYQLPKEAPSLEGLKVIHPGWWLGTVRKSNFEPSHALAMALPIQYTKQVERLNIGDPHLLAYLRGESLASPGPNGWTLIVLDVPSAPPALSLGWGKRSQGLLKNNYPRGLRWHY
jgi:NOL1/NOP2/fmu family ribosome biogenesis protein/23S rRNA U2552 (ribose-2'-O)-methylase RlmE/FtsJ